MQADLTPWLALRAVPGVGNVTALTLVRAFGDPQSVFRASIHALECAGVRPEVARAVHGFADWGYAQRQIQRLEAIGGAVLTWGDEGYPTLLRSLRDPPLVLFHRGRPDDSDRVAVALVGSRQPSEYGRRMARDLAGGLARMGITIVSGLARGVDAEAHAAALHAGGRTIAVLGSGIDVIYPIEHDRLFMSVSQQGCVYSELPPGTQPEAENFPARNRIISGLSLGTVVVEAAARSGSLITARCALEQGREVFAVPGPVGFRSRGGHSLLRQGATLVESADDVVRAIAPQLLAAVAPLPVLGQRDAAVFATVKGSAVSVDEVVQRSGLAVAEVLDSLLQLELRGLVRQLPGNLYVRQETGRAEARSAGS
jgi:DNA processing protein